MKVYVAARLSNIEAAKRLIAVIKNAGHEITYDWTEHGSVNGQGPVRYREVAEAELAGVLACDVVVALLPGGYGTHAEIGAALAREKSVILIGNHDGAYPCAFHYHPLVYATLRGYPNSGRNEAEVFALAAEAVTEAVEYRSRVMPRHAIG